MENTFSRTIGFILILISLFVISRIFYPVFKEEWIYKINKTVYEEQEKTLSGLKVDSVDLKEQIRPADENFSIIIPKIGANAPIVENVDPYNSKEYQQKLSFGVAHAKGTATPDKEGNVFLFAHSTATFPDARRFNAVFYLLDKLEKSDSFYIVYKGEIFKYIVTESKVVNASEVNYFMGPGGLKTATLMTCFPPGTTLKRLIIIGILE